MQGHSLVVCGCPAFGATGLVQSAGAPGRWSNRRLSARVALRCDTNRRDSIETVTAGSFRPRWGSPGQNRWSRPAWDLTVPPATSGSMFPAVPAVPSRQPSLHHQQPNPRPPATTPPPPETPAPDGNRRGLGVPPIPPLGLAVCAKAAGSTTPSWAGTATRTRPSKSASLKTG